MMAKRKELIFNLGSSHISAGLFLLADNVTLSKFYHQDLQPENGTEEEWLLLLEETLSEFTKKNRLSGKARFILPGSLVLSKTIRVPKVEESKKRKIVEYELSQKLPFPIKDLTWDFSVIDDDGIEEEILSFAIKPEVAHRLSKIIYSCGGNS
jgi:type IV pilus assembly protein PilM